jgi:hypothetical protein
MLQMKIEKEKAPMGRPFKHLIGDYVHGLKIVDVVEGDPFYRIFECPFCHSHFKAQVGNVKRGEVWNCGCAHELMEQAKQMIVENFKI